jgi:hypothetical protein
MSNTSQEQPAMHGFLMMGTEKLFLCHLPMFFATPHSYQVILEASLASPRVNSDRDTYLKTKSENPGKPLIIMNKKPTLLKDIVNSHSFLADAFFANDNGDPDPANHPFITSTNVNVDKPLVFEHLDPAKPDYPDNLTYYIFGSDYEFHISHLLTKAPNFEQELDVTLSGDISNKINQSNSKITKISILSEKEKSRQPIKKDPLTQSEYTVTMDDGTTGKISIGDKFFINNASLNEGMNMMDM